MTQKKEDSNKELKEFAGAAFIFSGIGLIVCSMELADNVPAFSVFLAILGIASILAFISLVAISPRRLNWPIVVARICSGLSIIAYIVVLVYFPYVPRKNHLLFFLFFMLLSIVALITTFVPDVFKHLKNPDRI